MLVIPIAAADFQEQVVAAQIPVLVDFWSSKCMPCYMQEMLLNNLSTALAEKVKLVKVSLDEHSGLSEKYRVFATPTLKLFKQGEVVATAVGLQSLDAVEKLLAPYID